MNYSSTWISQLSSSLLHFRAYTSITKEFPVHVQLTLQLFISFFLFPNLDPRTLSHSFWGFLIIFFSWYISIYINQSINFLSCPHTTNVFLRFAFLTCCSVRFTHLYRKGTEHFIWAAFFKVRHMFSPSLHSRPLLNKTK